MEISFSESPPDDACVRNELINSLESLRRQTIHSARRDKKCIIDTIKTWNEMIYSKYIEDTHGFVEYVNSLDVSSNLKLEIVRIFRRTTFGSIRYLHNWIQDALDIVDDPRGCETSRLYIEALGLCNERELDFNQTIDMLVYYVENNIKYLWKNTMFGLPDDGYAEMYTHLVDADLANDIASEAQHAYMKFMDNIGHS